MKHCILKKAILLLLHLIIMKTLMGQADIKFNIKDTVLTINKNTSLLKVNLELLKKDTSKEYNLYGFKNILPPGFIPPQVGLCNYNLGLICMMEDTTHEKLITEEFYLFSYDKMYYRLNDNNKENEVKLEYISVEFIKNNNLSDFYSYPEHFLANKIKINKEDTLISKDIFIKLDKVILNTGIYYITLAYNYNENWKTLCEKDSPIFIKNNPVENEYKKCIISNKIKVIVE